MRRICMLTLIAVLLPLTLSAQTRGDLPETGVLQSMYYQFFMYPFNQDFRFGSSDGTRLHPHPAKRNHFSTRKRRRLRRNRSSPLLAPHGG